jgi:hypothetical protein
MDILEHNFLKINRKMPSLIYYADIIRVEVQKNQQKQNIRTISG